ncbi:transcription factor Jun-like [Antennarius striatus]|uniref:transcription factor Jun-like n=1 Tax=Antennarius striatus TaxID=241820 RepID=UPI0035B139AC
MSRKMEATFYEEAVGASGAQRDGGPGFGVSPKTLKQSLTLNLNDPKTLKQSLTLNLNEPRGPQPPRGSRALDILTSPDVGLLKLASPELERLIIQSCSGLTTPTPTQFVCPKNITDEQEGFAEGFVRALAELHYHQQQGPGGGPPGAQPDSSGGAPYSCTARSDPPEYTNLGTFSRPGGAASAPAGGRPLPMSFPAETQAPPGALDPQPAAVQHPRLHALKEEPQTVPEMSGDTPPLSPINMENQERIKAERKRMRNRVAASKCRKRKLERISRLEERVKGLKNQNLELVSSANGLRDELALLKQKVMDHVNSGCQLILTQQLQAF